MTTSNSLMINPCKVLKKVSERDRPRKAEIKQDKNAEGRKDGNVNKWKDNKEKIRDIEKIDANSVVQEDEMPNPSLYTFRSEKFDEVTYLSTSCYAYVADVTETAIIKEEKILINKDTATSAEKGTVFPLLPPAKILSDIATWTKAENSTTISDNELIIEYQDVCKTINKNENLVIQMNNSQFSNIHESIPEETIQDVNNDFNKSEVEENSIGDHNDDVKTNITNISLVKVNNTSVIKDNRKKESKNLKEDCSKRMYSRNQPSKKYVYRRKNNVAPTETRGKTVDGEDNLREKRANHILTNAPAKAKYMKVAQGNSRLLLDKESSEIKHVVEKEIENKINKSSIFTNQIKCDIQAVAVKTIVEDDTPISLITKDIFYKPNLKTTCTNTEIRFEFPKNVQTEIIQTQTVESSNKTAQTTVFGINKKFIVFSPLHTIKNRLKYEKILYGKLKELGHKQNKH